MNLTQNKHGIWEVRWTDNGRSRRKSMGTKDKKQAREVMGVFQADGLFTPTTKCAETFALLFEQYRTEHGEFAVISDRNQYALKHLGHYFGNEPLSCLADAKRWRPLVRRYWTQRTAQSVADSTIRRELVVLKAALHHAHRWGRIDAVPFVELPKESEPRQEYLEADVLRDVLALAQDTTMEGPQTCDPYYRFLLIAAATGARKRSILELTWDRVDFKSGIVDFQNPDRPVSNKRSPRVPVSKALLSQMKGWAEVPTKYVCAPTSTWFNGAGWSQYVTDLGAPGLKPHTLRHSFATHLLQAGASLWQVAGLLGDTPQTVAKTYGHHSTDNLREALEAL